MGNCVTRSSAVQHQKYESSDFDFKDKTSLTLENDPSPSVMQFRSSEFMIAEPSDGSFAVFYPQLEFESQKLPKNDPSAASLAVESAVQKALLKQETHQEDTSPAIIALRQISLTESERSAKSSPLSNGIGSTTPTVSVRMYAREA